MHPKITPMLIAGLLAAVIATPSQAKQEERGNGNNCFCDLCL